MLTVAAVGVREPDVAAMMAALTAELAGGGYTAEQTFGYSADQLEQAGVHVIGARDDGLLVGIGGLERQDGGSGELKRMYVAPSHRGAGVADAVMTALLDAGAFGARKPRPVAAPAQAAPAAWAPVEGWQPNAYPADPTMSYVRGQPTGQ